MTSGTDGIVLVYGSDAAGVISALASADGAGVGGPYAVARGWWSIVVAGGTRDVLERAGDVDGMVIEAGGAPCALVSLKDGDGLTTFLAGMAEAKSNASRLAAWSAHAPRTISLRAAQRLLSESIGVKGREIAARLLQRLGFGEVRRGEPWEELDGAIGPVLLWDSPPFIGTQPFDVRSQRWRFAKLATGIGLWDFDGPPHPVEQWPTPEEAARIDTTAWGWLVPYDRRAHRCWYELVARPILERTVLDGDRAWGQFDRVHEGKRVSYRFVLHRSPHGVVSEIDVQPPHNTQWHMDGRIVVGREQARRYGVDGPTPDPDQPWDIEVPNRDFDDAKAAFRLRSMPEDDLLLVDIPDSVPRHLLDTCAYVRTVTHPRYPPPEYSDWWSLEPDDDAGTT